MKNHFLILLVFVPFWCGAQDAGFEFHCSVNHPLSSKSHRSFFGGGIGANVLFRDSRTFNIKTGLEVNYFHTWDYNAYGGKMSSRYNLHYQYVGLSFPAFVRFTFGERFKWFVETGAYLGVCVGGNVQYTDISYGPDANTSSTYEYSESYRTGLSVTPAAGLGIRFPLSERADLFLKPEFAFVKNYLGANIRHIYDPESHLKSDFNYMYLYARFCVGIHLKPKQDNK